MGKSFKLFTLWGIPVYLHISFGLIFVIILFNAWSEALNTAETLRYTALVLSVFVCVVLHEFGHALTARQYGIKTRDIVLLPIGGMARLERMPNKPWQEIVIAIAGPLVNVLIAIIISFCIAACCTPEDIEALNNVLNAQLSNQAGEINGVKPSATIEFLSLVAISNLILAAFNMIPAFPMDGGRVLRAILSFWTGRPRATLYAHFVGITVAILFIGWGIYSGNYSLSFLGVFIIFTARMENNFVQMESVLSKYKVKDIMQPQFTKLQHTAWMQDAISALHHGLERNFLIVNFQDEVLGSLHEEDILLARRKNDTSSVVTTYMRNTTPLHQDNELTLAYTTIFHRKAGIVPVVNDENQIIGVVDTQGLVYLLKYLA